MTLPRQMPAHDRRSFLRMLAASGAAASYVKEGYSNIRIGMFLEIATTLGALAGAHLTTVVPTSALAVLFGAVLLYSAWHSLQRPPSIKDSPPDPRPCDEQEGEDRVERGVFARHLALRVHDPDAHAISGGAVAGRADVLAALEFRPGKRKMKHPGPFNANPLSAAAGIATLNIVDDRETARKANEVGRQLRQQLNQLFAERSYPWIAYGVFSGFRLLPDYHGPRPTGDDFIPYSGVLDQLDGPRSPQLTFAIRQGMLLHGVDLFGLSGMTTAAHTADDVAKTVAAVAATVELLQE